MDDTGLTTPHLTRRHVVGAAAAGVTALALPSALSAASGEAGGGGAPSGLPEDDFNYFNGQIPGAGSTTYFISSTSSRRAWLFDAGVTSYVNSVWFTSVTGDKTRSSVKLYGGTTTEIGALIGTVTYHSESGNYVFLQKPGTPLTVPAGPVWIEIATSSSGSAADGFALQVPMRTQTSTTSESTPPWTISSAYSYYDFASAQYDDSAAGAPFFLVSFVQGLVS